GWRSGERYGEGCRRGRGDGAGRSAVEHDTVVAGSRIEAEAVDGERGRAGGEVGAGAGDDRGHRGDLDGGAAADAVGRDRGRQIAGGRRIGEGDGEGRGGGRGDGAGGPAAKGDRVVAGGQVETEAVDGQRARIG